ncbi:MAG: toll/interleukin-1 receptor domain-containing protein [Rhodomicrobium sp.]|nr:toll/interleukin-1 receptor domain-containing protein [Rhodomicrobium sp.]
MAAEGYSVWWDTSLLPGDSFTEVILNRIDSSRVVIVLWSPAAGQSAWVKTEASRAYAQGKMNPGPS